MFEQARLARSPMISTIYRGIAPEQRLSLFVMIHVLRWDDERNHPKKGTEQSSKTATPCLIMPDL